MSDNEPWQLMIPIALLAAEFGLFVYFASWASAG
jgi:hypothetical protein